MSVISKKSFLNKADKQQSNWEQTTGQEAGGVLNKQDFIRQAQSTAQQRRQAQEQKAPQSERSGFDRTATPASIAGLGAPAPTSQRQKERYNQEIGQYGVGNIDLYNRPQYRNADGSISTVDSTSFNIQGKEVLLPSVWMKDGKAYRSSDGDEILQHFYDTGEFLGIFDTVDAANSYAEKLHDAQDYYYTTQREKALDEAVAHDQLQGMKRTLAILESQKKQEQAQQPSILSMLGKASDSPLPTFQAESAQSETDRRIQELQDEIDRQESESQMQGTKRPETYTAKNVGRYKDRLIALASVPGIWTKRQKQEAEEIIGTQSGFGGLLGYEQNVTAFAPYQEAMRKGDTEAAAQWQQIYDVLYTRLYSKQTAVASGLQEGLGVTSAAAAVGKALGANEDEYHRQMENAQRAQEEHPVLAGGAKIAGSLALMSGIGEAAGAGLAAAGMNTGSLGFKVAAGALSFAGADAVHNAGAAAMGDMSTEDYLKRIAISGAQGMAGNLAGGLVGTGLANVLRDTHKMTPFMEFLRQTASGVTNASVNQAVGYLAADEKPTKEEIATNLVTAFAFSVLSSAISSYQTTQQQKAKMNQAYQDIEQGYRTMTAGTENMTPEAKAQRAQFIMQQTQSLRKSVNSYYVAGQQKAVDNLNETLDLIEEAMRAYVNGYAAASSAMQTPNVMLPGGGSTGQLPTAADLPTTPTDPQMQKQVEQELQTAIQQGLQQAQAGTQNTQPPESGQALQNGNAAAAAAQIAVQAAEQNQQAQQPSLPTAAQAAAVQPQQLEQSTQQEAGLPTPQQVQTEQTATPLERLETMGVSGKRAQSMARGIEAFYRGQITDGEVLRKLLSFPEVQNVMRQMTDADIEAVVSGNAQPQNQQPGNAAVQQVPGSQQPGVQNEATTHEGGMNNGTEQLPAGQQPGTEQQSEQLPDGDGGRILGESTGGQSGILAEGRPQRAFNQGRTAVERENLGRTLRLEKVSSQSLGLPNGTEEREIQVMPESHWDAQMQQTAQRISYETGKPVTYVLGSIRIRQADGSVSAARGVYTENGIIIQADHRYLNIDQIADHEAFHDYAANNPGLVRQIERAIVEQYSREEFDAIMDKYLKNLRGVCDLPEHASGQEVAEAYGIVKEEICADAYAGINFFGANADKYRSEAQAVLQERKITTPGSETAAATQRRTGPPERYSYGGVNANTADQKTLARAQELQMQGEDDERVRKETGWHTGMEGKLRFEIDDSKMKYHRGGDAAFSRNHPDYAEYQKLVDKMLTGSAEAWKPEDQGRLQELDKTWGREYGRLSERVDRGSATLEDVIDHEELFQAYPQLRNVRVEFKELPGNTQGYFSPSENKIALDSKLRSAPEATIIHEIQHAIQKAEGFASGASPEYWQQHRDEAKEARIADIREEIARLEEQLPWDLNRWTAEDDAVEAKIGELEDSIIDIQNGVGLDSYDLYRNTAGEIEARDAASRRGLTPEQRRAMPPARADENTVYADLSDSLDYVGKTDDGTEVYETSEAVRKLPYKKRMEAFMDIMRNEYAGRTAKFTARDGEVYYATFDENDLRKNVYGDKKSSPRGWKAKINTGADGNIFDLVENAEHSGSGKEQGKTSEAHQGLTGWEYFVKTVQIDGRVYDLLANVRKKPDGEFVYSIQLNENEKKAPAPPRQYQNGTAKAENRPVRVPTDASEASVAEKRLPVKARFSMDEPVEQTQDLMAIHNLDGKKMDSMLQLGAIPSPSVAIVKASQGHTQYGDYTLVFPRQSIDPKADRYATQDKLREAVDDADVEAWVRGQIRGVLGEPGIYNGKERFTASGKRRSFRETHGAYTAENIVKAMNRASARGESYWGVGAKGILSVATPRYKSVDAIHADEGRLQNMPEEEYNRLLQELDKRIGGIVADVQKTAGSYDMDEIAGLLMENAGQDAMRIQQAFSRQGYDIDGGLATEIAGMYRQAAEMPTGYFEAKPQRVVTFDEPVCIAPDDCPPERLEKMKAAGLNVIEYEAGNDEQRMEIARSLKGMRFSVDEPQAETGGEIEQASESKPAEPEQKEKKPRKKNETKPVAESLPIIAKRNLRQDMQDIFSIPEGRRAEINQIIDGLADRMLKNGELTQEDRDAFFDRMYAEGVMEVAADEYLQQARSEIAGRRIYVPESVKHEFGDDWGYFRKKAFAAGVMLVNDTSAAGIDMVNAELADTLPGMFHADDLDSREILENIVQTAEEGKSQNMSLAQYTALLAGQEYVSEDEVLDNIERQMDEALRTFTRTAKLEVHLRDRTGVKIAQEREKSAAARQREALSRAKERQQRKEMSQRQREYRELKEQQKKTLKALQWLAKNQYRAPEELQGTWDEVLGDLDIYAVSAANEMRYSKKYDATWKDLAEMYKDAQANDPNFLPSKELEKIVHRLDNKKIADMDLNALQDLYKAAVGLRTEFYNRNNVINDDMNRLFAEVYTDSKKELDFGAQTKAGEAARQGKKLDSLFNQEQLSPMNVMQRMAGWNPNGAWYSMAKQLEKGERDIRDYTVSATKQLREFLTEHEDWAKKADGQGDDGIWYEVKIPQLVGALEVGKPPKFGDTITVWMTPTQKVHMYLESKSTENLRHMEGGRTFADKTLYSQGKRREAFAQGKTVRMAPETVKAIVGSLTPEEQELAQALEQYYNVFAKKEINRVSNILYGYDKAVSKNYTPIYTNSNYTKSELGVYDATAEGVGNLKSRQFSKNPSYNIGAFDAFERHVEQTARFVGMAIPARNWQTLLNWRERENSMADIITHDWGDESLKYIQDLVQTLQGGAASTRDSVSMGAEKVFSNYIGAVFGANTSIVFKQLGSIPLAGAWLDFKNFPSPGQVKRIDRSLIEKYTQELDWRTLGYSTPETKQLKENPNWTQTNKFTNFIFGGGAITAMDGWAASVLWPWAENKVRAEFPELETGSQEQIDSGSSPFYQKVAEVFNEAVARSQSTSDEMHQGTLRKSKNPVTRAFTMFKSDSSQTYNALRQRAGEAEYYKRIGDTENYNKAKRGLGVAFLAAVGGYIWAQGIEFLMNLWKRKGKAYRDEDGNLTAGSVAKEMALGLVGDLAGIVTYGEELADVIGNIITGDKWYGIDTPGLEQLSDVVETIVEQGQNGLDVLKDAADVVKNGGSMGEYLHRHSGDIVGGIKDLAAAAATYLPGISVNNLEAYLLGTVRWASPELAAAYDDALATANKNQMKGLRGAELERKISDTLHNRRVETDETTNETLASLYESGFTKAVPSDTPGSISVDGEDRKLSAYQKQVYDKTWSSAVGSRLVALAASDVFQTADDETREKMLSGLYEYAGEKAKTAVFDDYEVKTSTQKADDVLATGAEMADYLELKLAGAVDKYLDAIDGGLDAQSAKDVALGMAELAPEEGKKTVSDVQKWRAAIDAVDGTSAQRDALLAVMKDSTKQKYEIADSYGIEARTWVQLKEILPQFDEDGNGSYKGEEIENAIDALNGHSGIMLPGGDGPQQLTNEMRAVLWQLFTGSKSAKNNPYSERVGSQVIAEREKAKRED